MNTAKISACGTYRYTLARGDGDLMAVVMLNPSTADASKDDNTIRKLRGFATRCGYDGITVRNLYAYRATNPKELLDKDADTIIGPDNWKHLDALAAEHSEIIVAWGANVADLLHERRVLNLLRQYGAKLMCFGVTKDGFPRHPLYLPNDARLQEYTR